MDCFFSGPDRLHGTTTDPREIDRAPPVIGAIFISSGFYTFSVLPQRCSCFGSAPYRISKIGTDKESQESESAMLSILCDCLSFLLDV